MIEQRERGFGISVILSADDIRRLDLLAAAEQQVPGQIGRVSRSAVVRALIRKHFQQLDGAAAPVQPVARVRARMRRKPASDGK